MTGLCKYNYVPTLILGGVRGGLLVLSGMSFGFLVVTSLVVGFLGYTLALFCTGCNLLVIVNRVNYFYVYTVVLFG